MYACKSRAPKNEENGNGEDAKECTVMQPAGNESVIESPPSLSVAKEYSRQEFLSLFVGHRWSEYCVFDVFPDGHIGEEILIRICGGPRRSLHVQDDNVVQFVAIFDGPPNHADTLETLGTYNYTERNLLRIKIPKNSHFQYSNPLTVLEINDSVMRCLGPVFSKKRVPEAVNGLYVYRRIDK